MSKCIIFGIFVDLAYSEHEETEMLAVFTYADELGFEPGFNSLERVGANFCGGVGRGWLWMKLIPTLFDQKQ